MGIVAHYYMDVELQGVLQAVQQSDPRLQHRIGIADSLKMGDLAVQMCHTDDEGGVGVSAVACLGVDFMSESVRAILQRNGYGHVPVYRAAAAPIGCSLAESAERDSYRAWLQQESQSSNDDNHHHYPLHVIYINTSLETKAISSSLVPTITCTSSNVLQTILQASAQVGPQLKLLYGPDTYMGHNLVTMLSTIASDWSDDRIRQELHALHSRDTIRTLRDNMRVFPNGNCVVHHMFGQQVVDMVRQQYDHAFVTAHLEVPGEMFQIAMEKSLVGRGVVGSTSDILRFITEKVKDAATNTKATATTTRQRLQFLLGTEAGMVTSIVKSVQDILERTGNESVEAEIIFPVASEAVMSVEDDDHQTELSVVPGVSGGEGCSTAGGCATCPFMKMNDLDALMEVLEMVQRNSPSDELRLQTHLPPNRLAGRRINGVDAMDLGTESILYMREFMKHKTLSAELVNKITGAGAAV
jgi:quinolinate synthase